MQQSVTRRAFLGAVVGAGVLVVPLASNADASASARANAAKPTIFGLSADWGAGRSACVPNNGQSTCGGCYACVRHAHNKVFATATAADTGRAHPHCKCVVISLGVLAPAIYDALFATRTSVDRRTPGIETLLTAPDPAPTDPRRPQTPGARRGTAPLTGTLPFTGARMAPIALGGLGALVVGATLLRSSPRARVAAPIPEPSGSPPIN